jgi:hypothetical protein
MENMSLDLGIKNQAWAVLHMLRQHEEVIADLGVPHMHVDSWAWYNSRERGISVVASYPGNQKCSLVCVFGEARNSDQIFVDACELEHYGFSPPSWEDKEYEKAYKNRKCFDAGNSGKAADYVWKQIQAWAKKQRLAMEQVA